MSDNDIMYIIMIIFYGFRLFDLNGPSLTNESNSIPFDFTHESMHNKSKPGLVLSFKHLLKVKLKLIP
jgi:hypothetical protein